jgi:hypothetical protein
MPGRNILSHHLPNLERPQLFNEPRPQDKTDEKGGQNSIDGPEGDIPEDIEKGEKFMKRVEKMIKHCFKPSP